jgi:ubiquinone biosynthesis protein UbiJ
MAEQPPDDHASRVRASFDALHEKVGSQLDDASRAAVERVRDAAASKDVEALRTHVDELKQRHGWLYRELATHPQIANLLDELALLGL